jgi:hypothetical protein
MARLSGQRLLIGREWMLFVDGENFTRRAQDLLQEAGERPEVLATQHRRDVFLWPSVEARWHAIASRTIWDPPIGPPRRCYYYTSTGSDEPGWTEAQLQIRDVGFEPRLFKRITGRKAKAVDVALAADVITLGATDQYQVAVIVAGDADYVPVLESVKRLGLHVLVAFFAGSTSPQLRIAADEYVDLTESLTIDWIELVKHFERQEVRRQAAAGRKPSP